MPSNVNSTKRFLKRASGEKLKIDRDLICFKRTGLYFTGFNHLRHNRSILHEL